MMNLNTVTSKVQDKLKLPYNKLKYQDKTLNLKERSVNLYLQLKSLLPVQLRKNLLKNPKKIREVVQI